MSTKQEQAMHRVLGKIIVTIDPTLSLRTKFGEIKQASFAGAPVGVLKLVAEYVITRQLMTKIIDEICEGVRTVFKDKDLLHKMVTESFHYNSIDEWLADLETILPEEGT
jgi:F420-dependent methylenetetrahydromethanopterin dehydrogenase